MYRRILAAVNEHTNSLTAARYAIILAKSCGAALTFLFAADEKTDRDAFTSAESGLQTLFLEAEKAGLRVESVIEKGPPATTILEQAGEREVDLLFAATRHRPSTEGFLGKSVSRKLLMEAHCSVAVVKAVKMGHPRPGRILMPLGGLAPAAPERAFFVSKLAEGAGAKIILFHVAKPARKLFWGLKPSPAVEAGHLVPQDMQTVMEIFKEKGIPHEGKVVRGGDVFRTTHEAAVRGSDLMVVGASRRGLLKQVIMGSAIEQLLHETPCNLIIFRPRRHGHTEP